MTAAILPMDEFIAQAPASPRDHSKLLVYRTATDEIFLDSFFNLARYLPERAFLAFNKTRVVPARVNLQKETGGRVETLFLMNEFQPGDTTVKALLARKVLPGQRLFLKSAPRSTQSSALPDIGNLKCAFFVEKQDKKIFTLRPDFSGLSSIGGGAARRKKPDIGKTLLNLLEKFGSTPIPPYIRNTPLKENALRKKYQTVFAKHKGSVAAPTAALHFTSRVFDSLKRRGIPSFFITLHVGLGTFAPVTEENMKRKKLFEEWYEIEEKTAHRIITFKKAGRPLIAVGTTTVRTLESYAKTGIKSGTTDLFITPPYPFKLVDGLITNFHLPGSSLLLLVAAFLQHKKSRRNLRDLYDIAIQNKFRFYSFGDAMTII